MSTKLKSGPPPDHKRRSEIVSMRSQGMSYADIARAFGVSRQAVRQMFLRTLLAMQNA